MLVVSLEFNRTTILYYFPGRTNRVGLGCPWGQRRVAAAVKASRELVRASKRTLSVFASKFRINCQTLEGMAVL